MDERYYNNEKHWQTLVLILKHIAIEKNITQDDIAEKTGLQRQNVNRIFNLHYRPRLDIFISIAQAIGVNFFLEDKESKTDLNKAFERAMEELGRRPDKLNKN